MAYICNLHLLYTQLRISYAAWIHPVPCLVSCESITLCTACNCHVSVCPVRNLVPRAAGMGQPATGCVRPASPALLCPEPVPYLSEAIAGMSAGCRDRVKTAPRHRSAAAHALQPIGNPRTGNDEDWKTERAPSPSHGDLRPTEVAVIRRPHRS